MCGTVSRVNAAVHAADTRAFPIPAADEALAPSPFLPPSPQVGWKHQGAVAELEAKRKTKATAFYEAKKKAAALRAKAVASL